MIEEISELWSKAVFGIGLNKFPITQSVKYKKQLLGTLTVDFKPAKRMDYYKKENALEEKKIIGEFLIHCEKEIFPFFDRMESELELYLRKEEEIDKDFFLKSASATFLDWLLKGHSLAPMALLSERLYIDDEFLFDLLKTEGPRLLANSGVIRKLEKWTKERNHVNLDRMKDALCMYFSPKDLLYKVGRPSKKVAKTNFRVAYKYLLATLRYVKKCKSWNEARKRDSEVLKRLKKVKKIPNELINNWQETQGNIVQLQIIIDSDEKLINEFYEFKWPPHDIAKKILEKYTGMSYEKIRNILYR